MTGDKFYKMRLIPDRAGLNVVTFEYYSIHETPCFHFCVREFYKNYPLTKGDTRIQMLKRMGVKVYRVGKNKKVVELDFSKTIVIPDTIQTMGELFVFD